MADIFTIILAIVFFIDFVLFNWAVVLLIVAKGDINMAQRGRKMLKMAFSFLFLFLLALLIFYAYNSWFKKGEEQGEFPPSYATAGVYPPAPGFFKISQKYYFSQPSQLDSKASIDKQAIYAVLCKDADKYDILYIKDSDGRENVSENGQYQCWLEKCKQNSKNLYYSTFETTLEKYTMEVKQGIVSELKEKESPPCVEPVKEEDNNFVQ